MDTNERIRLLETGLVECFDVAIPQAMTWTGTFSEKADYAAKVLPEQLRGMARIHQSRNQQATDLLNALREALRKALPTLYVHQGATTKALTNEIQALLAEPQPAQQGDGE